MDLCDFQIFSENKQDLQQDVGGYITLPFHVYLIDISVFILYVNKHIIRDGCVTLRSIKTADS